MWVGLRFNFNIPLMPDFWRLDFYTPPILLETVEGFDALGFILNPHQRTTTSILPWDTVIRTTTGSGPLSRVLSGLMSRVRLILTNTWPMTLQLPQIQGLVALHLHRDPAYGQCIPHIVQLAHRHGHRWTPSMICQYV